jgi:hypothetical protein
MDAKTKKKYETLKIGPFTGAYVNGLFEASAIDDNQEPKYGITFLIPKDLDPKSTAGKSLAALRAKIEAVFIQKFGPKDLEKFRKNLPPWKNFPIRDGDVDKSDKPEFAGKLFIGARSKTRPGIVDRHLHPITDKDEIWSGCQFVADVGVFAYEIKNKQGAVTAKGVSVGLNHVLFWEKGDRIDNRKSATETFAEFAEDGAGEGGGDEESALD